MDEHILDGFLALLINVFLIVGHKSLGEGLTDGVDLGDATAALDADSDVDLGEPVLAEEEERLLELELQGLGLNLVEGLAVDTDDALKTKVKSSIST